MRKQSGDELPQSQLSDDLFDDMAVVESAKTASDVYAPISGEIIAVNGEIAGENWEIINQSPQAKGWFVKLKPANTAEFDALMDEAAYADYVKGLA